MFKGSHHSKEAKRKMSKRKKGIYVGAKHNSWKGGRKKDKGYVYLYLPNHPNCNSRNYVAEHHIVMEAHLGRTLLPTEIVHHINGIRDDNRIENLMLFTNIGKHIAHHHKLRSKLGGKDENLEG